MPKSKAQAEPARRQLRDVLAAAALGPEQVKGDLARGRLLVEPEPIGFGGLAATTTVRPPAAGGGRLGAAHDKEAERRASRVAAMRLRLNAATDAARDADNRAKEVEAQAARAQTEAGRLVREAEAARRRADDKRQAANRLADELDQLK